ncbi:hypothetical protein BYT27DRAFT_7220089 [Phlegmacium glaucopus]|nr:hypothetical protein BYT27DRAFT_7220089 [Phlegmacium glaucopus]
MSSDPLANFTCLDELVQVIYQSIYKFVVLSTVSQDEWHVHLGLAGSEGRWWHGSWKEEDIHRIFGPTSSDKLLESFAERLAEVFIQGELCLSDWSPEKGAKIKFTLGPASKRPMHIPLVEMTPEEAAEHATKVFLDIALQAQSRKCRIYPPVSEYSIPNPPPTLKTFKGRSPSPEVHARDNIASSSSNKDNKPKEANSEARLAQEEIKLLKSQLQNQKRTVSEVEKPVPPAAARPHKGASLANPNKKARKYQAIEFGSDDE